MNEDHPRNVYGSSSATIAAEKASADAQMAELTAAYNNHPENKLARDREALERMRNDPHHLNKVLGGSNAAANEENMLAAKIRDAENLLEAAGSSGTAAPEVDPAAARRVSFGQQIPAPDFEDAVDTLLEQGVRPTLVGSFLMHGHGDNPNESREFEQERAEEWLRNLMSDPEKQRKLLARDPETLRQFAAYGMYAADPRR